MPRPYRKFLAASGTVAIVVLVATKLVGSSELPEPYATQSDLPAIPDGERNGWTYLQGSWSEAALELDAEIQMGLSQVSNETESADGRWAPLWEHSTRFRAAAAASGRQDALTAWHNAAAAEAFVDPCPTQAGELCGDFTYYELHRLAMVEIVAHVLDEKWSTANRRLAQAIRLDRRLLASCRDALSASVAIASLNDALALTELVLHRQIPNAADGVELAKELRALDDEQDLLLGFDVKHRVLLGAYLSQRRGLERAEKEGSAALRGDSIWPPSFLYDAEHSARLIDEVHLELRAKHGPPIVRVGRDDDMDPIRCGWWDHIANAIGCSVFDPDAVRASDQRMRATIDEDLLTAQRWLPRIEGRRR